MALLGATACGDDGGGGGPAGPGPADAGVDVGGDALLGDVGGGAVDGVTPSDGTGDAGGDAAQADAGPGACGAGTCANPWATRCEADGALSICAPVGSCLAWGPAIACVAGACDAGACGAGCAIPRAMLLVDRSSHMTGLLWDQVTAAVGAVARDNPAGVELGVRVFPAQGGACAAGPIHPPAFAAADAVAAALVPPTASETTPLAAALRGLDDALGPPRDATLALVLLAGGETCEDATAVRLAAQALRARGVTVQAFDVGGGADTDILGQIEAATGRAPLAASTAAELEAGLRATLLAAGACCVDTDGDGRGAFCEAGPDCNDADDGIFAPSCEGLQCGDDGCGGSCGTCPAPEHGAGVCGAGQCSIACDGGGHECGGACVDDTSPEHCGGSCDPCPTDPHGEATCTDGACGVGCAEGYHLCDACVPDDSIDACGAGCELCPTDPLGSATCVDGGCVLTCAEGALLCEGACAPCPTGAGIEETACDGAACVVAACSAVTLPCGDACCDRVTLDVGLAGGDGMEGATPAMEVDPLGVARVAWAHRASNFAGEVWYAEGTWQGFSAEKLASGPYGAYGWPCRLALDAQGRSHVGWRAGTTATSPVLMHARRDAGAFGPQTVLADGQGAWPYEGVDFTVVIPKGGSPTALYPSSSRMSLASWNGVVVSNGTVADALGKDYTEAPAAIDGGGGLLDVVLVEEAGADWGLAHANGTGSTWATGPVLDGLVPEAGDRIDLARAPGGELAACAFTDEGLVLLTRADGVWTPELVDADGRQACAIAFGPDGTTHLAYRTLYGAIGHAARVDGAWVAELLAEPSGPPSAGLRWPSLAIDASGGLHAAWWDQTAAVVRYQYAPVAGP